MTRDNIISCLKNSEELAKLYRDDHQQLYGRVKFEPITEVEKRNMNQVIPFSSQVESKLGLSFKMLKCDKCHVIRETLKANGFTQTENHDWNVMWVNSAVRQYLFNNLNSHQKVNHFPCSYEITRKDKKSEAI